MLNAEEKCNQLNLGIYKYRKMKKLKMTLTEFIEYEINIKKAIDLKRKIGYRKYNEMKAFGMNLNEFEKYQKSIKNNSNSKRIEKNRVRYRTIRYIQRYCNIELKCQICGKEKPEIHHPNYKDNLKVNLLCKKHHNDLHNFELIPPNIIDLEKYAIKKGILCEKQGYIKSKIDEMRVDILENNYNWTKLSCKYKISTATIIKYFKKEKDYNELNIKINAINLFQSKSKDNLIRTFRKEHRMSLKNFSQMSEIPIPTVVKIENYKTNISKLSVKTKTKLRNIGLMI